MVLTAEQLALREKWQIDANRYVDDVSRIKNDVLVLINSKLGREIQFTILSRGQNSLIEYNGGPINHPIISIKSPVLIPKDFKKTSQPIYMIFFSIEGTGIRKEYHKNFTVGVGEYKVADLEKIKKTIFSKIKQFVL